MQTLVKQKLMICIRWEYLKPYNCVQIICIKEEYLISYCVQKTLKKQLQKNANMKVL